MTPDGAARPLDVVAIGNAIVDVLARADDDFLDRHGMVKGSMQLIDEDLAHRIYADMGPAVETSGGAAANTSAGLASFGRRVAFIGRVADDELGEVFAHDIRAAGVEFTASNSWSSGSPSSGSSSSGSGVGDARTTARCLILVTPDAQRTMNTFLGVSSLISPDDVDADVVARAKVVYCEGYLWDLPDAKAALVKGMEVAHANGGQVAFTLSDSFCVDRHRAEFVELIDSHVDILFGNAAELLSLYETDIWEDAVARVAGHCDIACLTRGEDGSVIVTRDGQRVEVAARRLGDLVDTTGAGDLYAAGFLHGYTTGLDLAESGRLASLAAGEVISHVGARPQVDLSTLV
jgi:sugar/nucleoside kinase (ribokinase family)